MSHIEITSAQTLVTTAETIIGAWSPIIGPPLPGEPIGTQGVVPTEFTGNANITPGTAATQIQLRVRQGGITGAIVGTALADDVTAAIPVNIPFTAEDLAGNASGYVLTAQQVAATGNGTVNYVSADAVTE